MGCANTKTGGAPGCGTAEDCIPEGGEVNAQKEMPKVMVDGEEVAVNGNVVNANGVEDGTTVEGKEQACNGDLIENKRVSKATSEAADEENKSGVATPSGDDKSNELNGGDAVMAADAGEGEEKDTAAKDDSEEKDEQGKDESNDNDASSPAADAAESREDNHED